MSPSAPSEDSIFDSPKFPGRGNQGAIPRHLTGKTRRAIPRAGKRKGNGKGIVKTNVSIIYIWFYILHIPLISPIPLPLPSRRIFYIYRHLLGGCEYRNYGARGREEGNGGNGTIGAWVLPAGGAAKNVPPPAFAPNSHTSCDPYPT